eukprot:TRINITY_DN194_c0_g1_i3.p1 TRINITY_DN194_c0_g1~~TRINITY_DN194_c0_g1_i3.p1  ORF type:complete len:174 (-),score=12.18 TRINITY_DN194_c0_g1_i3:54-575(-)
MRHHNGCANAAPKHGRGCFRPPWQCLALTRALRSRSSESRRPFVQAAPHVLRESDPCTLRYQRRVHGVHHEFSQQQQQQQHDACMYTNTVLMAPKLAVNATATCLARTGVSGPFEQSSETPKFADQSGRRAKSEAPRANFNSPALQLELHADARNSIPCLEDKARNENNNIEH